MGEELRLHNRNDSVQKIKKMEQRYDILESSSKKYSRHTNTKSFGMGQPVKLSDVFRGGAQTMTRPIGASNNLGTTNSG